MEQFMDEKKSQPRLLLTFNDILSVFYFSKFYVEAVVFIKVSFKYQKIVHGFHMVGICLCRKKFLSTSLNQLSHQRLMAIGKTYTDENIDRVHRIGKTYTDKNTGKKILENLVNIFMMQERSITPIINGNQVNIYLVYRLISQEGNIYYLIKSRSSK